MLLLNLAVVEIPARAEIVSTQETIISTDEPQIDWHPCGSKLLLMSGRLQGETGKLLTLYTRSVRRTDTVFLQHLMALIFIESKFNRNATSHAGAYGLTQLTDVAIKDAAKYCHLPVKKASELFDVSQNVKYGACYLDLLLSQVDQDYTRATIMYNGGYRQLTKYELGQPMTLETSNYALQVERAYRACTAETGQEE